MPSNVSPIRVLIVDEQELMRLGLRQALKDVSDIKIIGEVIDSEEILEFTKPLLPDVILIGLETAGISQIDVIRRIARINSKIGILVLTSCGKKIYFTDFSPDIVIDYIAKNISARELLLAIRAVYNKKRCVNSEIAEYSRFGVIEKQQHPFYDLSHRELQITTMLARGYATHEISRYLDLSVKTINSYCYRVFKKLKIKGRVALVRLAMQSGLAEENI